MTKRGGNAEEGNQWRAETKFYFGVKRLLFQVEGGGINLVSGFFILKCLVQACECQARLPVAVKKKQKKLKCFHEETVSK